MHNCRRATPLVNLATILVAVRARAQQSEIIVQTGHASPVNVVSFCPRGKLLASGSDNSDESSVVEQPNIVTLASAMLLREKHLQRRVAEST